MCALITPKLVLKSRFWLWPERKLWRVIDHDEEVSISLYQEQIFQAQRVVLELYLAPQLEEYLVQLVLASRDPRGYGDDLARWISFGASPRGTIALDRCARAHAWLAGRDYVSPGRYSCCCP